MKTRRKEILYFICAPFFCLWLLETLAWQNLWAFFVLLTYPHIFLLNYAFFLAPCLLFSCFRSYRVRAFLTLVLCLFAAALGFANHYKLAFRLEPVLLTDLHQFNDAVATVTGLDFNLNFGLILGVCLPLLAAMVFCALRIRKKSPKRHLLLPVIGLALGIAVPFLCTHKTTGGSSLFNLVDQAKAYGCVYTAFSAENYRRAVLDVPCDQETVEAVYRRLKAEAPKAVETADAPNIIFVLSESFTDQAMLSEYLDFTDTLMPFYQSLVQECLTGKLYAPKVGGGTSETEFEVLTGIQSQYSINPYAMGLPPINSIASILGRKGYTSAAIHWYNGVYYNRYQNLPKEGFQAIYTTDTTDRDFEKIGMFVSDRDHYNAIMHQLHFTPGKDFIFCLTMQNHGGYSYDDFRITYGADKPFTNSLSPESEKNVVNYCYLLRQSDIALQEWINQLKAFAEPTLVVFFGDHLAPLGMGAYQELGISTTGEESHLTPYFIWSNVETLQGECDLNAYQLGPFALSLAGLNDDPFMAYVERLRQQGVTKDEDYDLLSYDALFGSQYAYRLAGIQPENKACQIGGEMNLQGFETAVLGDRIFFRPMLSESGQRYRLLLNGRTYTSPYLFESDQPLSFQCDLSNHAGLLYNQSQVLNFQNTEDFLAKSDPYPYAQLPLWETSFELVQNEWHQNYVVFQSLTPFPVGKQTAVLFREKLLEQGNGGLPSKVNQYLLTEDDILVLSILKSALPTQDAQGLSTYLAQQNARLIAFED